MERVNCETVKKREMKTLHHSNYKSLNGVNISGLFSHCTVNMYSGMYVRLNF